MFGKGIQDELPECIFENFEVAQVETRVILKFSKIARVIYPKNPPS